MSNTPILSQKLQPGSAFPDIKVSLLNDEVVSLGQGGTHWQMLVVYRGRHCPLCSRYLNELALHKDALLRIGVELIAVSADSKKQVQSHLDELKVNFPLAYGLSVSQMKSLGLFISDPRSEQETDHVFAEPALFVINEDGKIVVADISNNPFARPELQTLLNGLAWIKNPDNHYPIRGMHI